MTDAVLLADELVQTFFDARPVDATMLGSHDRDDRLSDFTEAGEAAMREKCADIAARARAIDPTTLTGTDRLTRAVVIDQAEAGAVIFGARGVEYTIIDSDFAPVTNLLTLLSLHELQEPAHANGYLARLAGLPDLLEVVAGRHRMGIAAGRLPIRRHTEATVAYLDRYLADGAEPLRRPQAPVGAEGFDAERDRLLGDVVSPALAAYREVLATEVAPHGRPDDRGGLCWLPDGEALYARLVRAQTTTERTPDELHDTGLAIIARLADEYAAIASPVFGTTVLAAIFTRLREDPELRWRDGDELLAAARDTIVRAEEAAPRWFGRLPAQKCAVEPVPAEMAPAAAGASYQPPPLDGSRPGIYFANTYRAEERDRFVSEATAFHEAVPGHHFQLTVALELTDLPLLRRLPTIEAYLEGWGLYAERLADEMGLYSDAVSRLGMLTLDSLRAARLVVDTGLHAKGWSRQQAVDYMRAHTPISPVEIESEVDRYIAAPAQALAYMVGRLEIERIRAEAERALGDRFDIRAFHDTVLGNGALPLVVLDEVVRSWVDTQR
jgi:uncharacterized protein (DUF885 family)